jgi:hypothetical protein
MKFSYEMPDEQAGKMVASFCQQYGYAPTIQEADKEGNPQTVENPVSPMQFAFAQVTSFISQVVDAHLVWEQNQKVPELVAEEKKKLGELEITISQE